MSLADTLIIFALVGLGMIAATLTAYLAGLRDGRRGRRL